MMQICLVIPYYEDPGGLELALKSVQLEADDLVIVVDDGSVQFPASPFIPKFVGVTPVRLLELQENSGITAALNRGIKEAPREFPLIARLDCGDRAAPERFSIQREFFERNPDIALVGSWVTFADTDGKFLYLLKHPETHSEIRAAMRVNSAFSHPSVMFRRSGFDELGGYPTDVPAAEDFALFYKFCKAYKTANIPIPLVECRTGDGGISEKKRQLQLRSRIKILVQNFDWRPMAAWGILRALLQMLTSRKASTRIRQLLGKNQ